MKILLCERSFEGHRKTYMEWLAEVPGVEFYFLAPENLGMDETHFIKVKAVNNLKTIGAYLSWIKQIKSIVKNSDIDVVHILDGDSIMRYFGIGFGLIGAKKIVITYHHFFAGMARKISYHLMCWGKARVCVGHTSSVQHSLQALGLKNVVQCEYPAFCFDSIANREPVRCKEKLGIPSDVPTIGIIGGMSVYKNIIPFLEIMKRCKKDFHLLVCGKENGIKETDIRNAVEPYADRVTLMIKQLTDEEYEEAIVASDIIYCIYGREFNGASGPLTDGVCAKKMILSCKHGSLGEIVSQNLLGVTADCGNKEEVLKQTELALSRALKFRYSEMAERYRERLRPTEFQTVYKKIYLTL